MEDDATLGGYLKKHDRPPAFEGSDGRPYSVEIYVDDEPCEDGRYGAAILFLHWSTDGEHVEGHLESGFLAYGDTADEARSTMQQLTLHEAKAQLEQLIETRKEIPPWQ
ncbi:MAG: hypothetical protein JSW51_13630 [Gemmatimonadota bacterium]|nr:MAG: hypothetical protein JSW51_13630 [Gemmatimonadota bacterium]